MLNNTEKQQLKELARRSIRHGLATGEPLRVKLDEFGENLQVVGASFVSLHLRGRLRGCMGSLEAHRALADDVARNAYAAAFLDTRFMPLQEEELQELDIHISILSPRSPMCVRSENDLLEQLQPGVDGLLIELGERRATFLPAVWKELPNPRDFVNQLKRKAGLDPNKWEPGIQVSRYTTTEF
jgi:hypothetical protein